MKPNEKLAWISGFAGLGLLVFGALAYHRRRNGGLFGLGRGQAPVINSYSDGEMRTTLRASEDMPIEERLASIQALIHKSVQDPAMRKLALQITAKCPERDKMCEAQAIYMAVKGRVRYTGDIGPIRHPDGSIEGIDLYQSARRTWEFGGGDCDDQAIVIATLLSLNGLTPRLRVVKTRGAPDWEHIFPGFMDTGKFVPLDATLPGNNNFGVEPNYHKFIDFDA